MPSLLERLKGGRVGQWALAYVGGAWLTLQVVDILGEQFGWPLRLQQSVTVLLVFGFFIAVVLAWYHGEKGRQRFTAAELLIIGFLLVIAAGAVRVLRSPDGQEPRSAVGRSAVINIPPSVVAVLPFENLGGDDSDYIASGIHEDILTQLSAIRDLTVISRRSVLRYADGQRDIPRIAAELGARSVVEGSVRRDQDRLRVTVQLIDASTDSHIWADTYDRTLRDIFQIQSDIALQVASALKATLSALEVRRLERTAAVGLGAWELVQRARALGIGTRERRTDALNEERILREALAVDPGYARAWALLASNFAARPWDLGMQPFWADSALEAARRAIELDPDLALGYHAFGDVYRDAGFLDEAAENYERAITLDPNLASAYRELGRVASVRGRYDEALRYLRQALRRDPFMLTLRSEFGHAYGALGDIGTAERWFQAETELRAEAGASSDDMRAWAYWWSGRFGEAVAAESRAVASQPGNSVYRVGLAELSLMNGDPEAAARYAREAMRMEPETGNLAYLFFATTTLGVALRLSGDSASARPFLEASRNRLVAQIERGVQWPLTRLELAAVENGLGNRELALQWGRRALESGSRHVHLIESSPAFDKLRDDPEFRGILDRMRADLAQLRTIVTQEEQEAGLR